MENLKLFFRIYLGPGAAMSDVIDRGSWLFAAVAVLVVAGAFYATINVKLTEAYQIRSFQEFYQPGPDDEKDEAERQGSTKPSRPTTPKWRDALGSR